MEQELANQYFKQAQQLPQEQSQQLEQEQEQQLNVDNQQKNKYNKIQQKHYQQMDEEQPPVNNEIISSITKSKFQRYFGNYVVFCYCRNEPLIAIGPHWPLFVCTFSVFCVVGWLLTHYVATQKGEFWYIATIAVTSMQLGSYALTALVNPGIKTAKTPIPIGEKGIGYCSLCNVKKDNDTYHCYDCQVCITGYDHHCPWTGKCIGKGNYLYFQFFISCTGFFFFYCLILAIIV